MIQQINGEIHIQRDMGTRTHMHMHT